MLPAGARGGRWRRARDGGLGEPWVAAPGRATLSVTGFAPERLVATNDLELQALFPGTLGIPKLNWNLQGKACGHLCCLSRVARSSLRSNSRGILNNSKQIGIPGLDWNPRSAHTPHPRVLPRRARGSCSVEQRHTHKSDTGADIYLSTQQPRALCRLVEELLRRDFLSFRNLIPRTELVGFL